VRPGDTAHLIVDVITDATGAPATGLVTGDFAVAGYLNAATPAIAFTAAEIGAGRYRLAVTLPATPGWLTLVATSTGRTLTPASWEGEMQSQDLDSIYAAAVVARVTISGISRLAQSRQLELIAYRQAAIELQLTDSAGAPVDLSGYTNLRFTVRDRLHASVNVVISSGITGSAEGVLAWTVPEDAAFFAEITAAITNGQDSTALYYDVVGDAGGVAANSRTLVRGPLILHRYEGAAS
jgi:hypothetical protein